LSDGTAIGLATAESVNLLRDSRAKSRIVVLLTDGENNAGSVQPLQAARLAEALGVRLYTIGVGSSRAELDEATLQKMAEIGGGLYQHAADAQALAAIYDRIDDLEKSRVTRDRFLSFDELAPYALAAAVAAVVLEALLAATLFRRIP
jgi:Ca-activated chloride channel family protein